MHLPLIAYGLLACAVAQVSATALTYNLTPNEKACFYTATKNKGEKIAFYFAVCQTTVPPQSTHSNIATAGTSRRLLRR